VQLVLLLPCPYMLKLVSSSVTRTRFSLLVHLICTSNNHHVPTVLKSTSHQLMTLMNLKVWNIEPCPLSFLG